MEKLEGISDSKLAEFVNNSIKNVDLKGYIIYIPEKFVKIKDVIKHDSVQVKNDLSAGFQLEKDGQIKDFTFKGLFAKYKDQILDMFK